MVITDLLLEVQCIPEAGGVPHAERLTVVHVSGTELNACMRMSILKELRQTTEDADIVAYVIHIKVRRSKSGFLHLGPVRRLNATDSRLSINDL